MIHVIAPGDQHTTATLVAAALVRSCGLGSAEVGHIEVARQALARPDAGAIWVFISPRAEWAQSLCALLAHGHKLLLLGSLPPALAQHLNAEVAPLAASLQEAAACAPAPTYGASESPARIHYHNAVAKRLAGHPAPIAERALCRYDFTDEWNNLGWGAVRADGTPWALAQQVQVPAIHALASLSDGQSDLGTFAALWDSGPASVLWFNRPVGPIDSQEWRLVEDFLSCHRPDTLPCQPVLAEVPDGFEAAVTMRLDCDEDIESARALWQLYQRERVPFSLALHAKVLTESRQHLLPKEVLAKGGALLSHTATHAPDWGGSYAAAFVEGASSAQAIEAATGHRVRHAVSPFHQTPTYARQALADAGYRACVGGLIRNDPDFLMARSGLPPQGASGFIGHSQQCMLHGDCMLAQGDPLRIFRLAFDQAAAAGAFFGYLDHPFSERYQYGWHSEAQRINAHRDFIAHIKGQPGVLFAHQDDALDFLHARAHTRVQAQVRAHVPGWHLRFPGSARGWALAVRWQGRTHRVQADGALEGAAQSTCLDNGWLA